MVRHKLPLLGARAERFDLVHARRDASTLRIEQARRLGVQAKPLTIGPVTYLWLGKCKDSGFDRLKLLERLLPVYRQLLQVLASNGAEWVQVDEPVLVTELTPAWKGAIKAAYTGLAGSESVPGRKQAKLRLTTYFGALQENVELVVQLPVAGVHVDVVAGP